jgi:hypothetical protein
MDETKAPPWLAYPGSVLRLLMERGEPPILRVVGNPQGLASLAGTLLWLQSFSDHGAMSISALPFVRPEGAIALSVVMAMEESPYQGRLLRIDHHRQFELHITDEQLSRLSIQVHGLATNAEYLGYSDASVSPDSDAPLRFEAKLGAGGGDHAR